MSDFFRIIAKDKQTKARLGILHTPHGKLETPSYVMVATHASIRHLSPADIKKTKTQLVISNTYHLWQRALKRQGPRDKGQGKNKLDSFLTQNLGLSMPTMTDSGGFQVFSLAFGMQDKVGKILQIRDKDQGTLLRQGFGGQARTKIKRKNIKITDKGVYFRLDGKERFLGPELSMKLQEKIGADIIFAFDECTSPLDDYNYNKKALKRTDKWAEICLETHNRLSRLRQGYGEPRQALFGIVQGGMFRDLREQSAKSIGSMPFDGFGIGGSFRKEEIEKVLGWITPYLPEEKPRHLLGIGKIEDIFCAVENGMDTFDCVIPTREARHARLWTKTEKIDIRKGKYLKDKKIIETGCKCPTCSKKISRAELRKLFKSQDLKDSALGQRYALMHNMWFFNTLLEDIRKAIKAGRFTQFKKSFLAKFKS